MSPSPNRQAVFVGLFVSLAVAVLVGVILTIGDLNDTFTKKLTVTSVFDEVNGLQQGDNVWFSGVKVGIVKGLAFHGGAQVEVTLKVDRSAAVFIRGDALAKIGSDGLIGNKIVVLYGGTEGSPALADGGVVVSAAALSTETILATLQENNTNLLAITTDLRGLSGALAKGDGTVGKLLTDDTLYTDVSATVATLGAASTNAQAMTSSLSTFSAKLNRPGNLPNDLVTDTTTYASLTDTVGALHQTGESAARLVTGLTDATASADTPVGALLHDPAAGAHLKATLANLSQGSALLTEDLDAAQHSFLLRGAFKKKARADAKAKAEAEVAAAAAADGQ